MTVYKGLRVSLLHAIELIAGVPGVQAAQDELTLALRQSDVRWWGKDFRGAEAAIAPEQSARLRGLLPNENAALFDTGHDIDDLLSRNWRRDHIEVDRRDLERIWRVERTTKHSERALSNTRPYLPQARADEFVKKIVQQENEAGRPIVPVRVLRDAATKAGLDFRREQLRLAQHKYARGSRGIHPGKSPKS